MRPARLRVGMCITVLVSAMSAVGLAAGADGAAVSPLPALYDQALKLEAARELTRAKQTYRDVVRQYRCDMSWRLLRDAQQGLLRVADLQAEFSLSAEELQRSLAKTYRDFRPAELADWERRGWILSAQVDGRKVYGSSNPTNARFFDTAIMARNETATQGYRQFAQIFLDEGAKLDAARRTRSVPEHYVEPVCMMYVARLTVAAADLPVGPTVSVWCPYPLLTPAIQNIRTLSVYPAGALKSAPDVEGSIGVAYLEVPRPEKGELMVQMKIAFDAYHTDFQIDPDRIGPYDTHSDLYRRFTRSEQQIALTPPLCDLARSIVGREINPYRKARMLYDWVCDNLKYNFVWHWRDATFTYGCASEEVRQRRIGDCVIQSVFYAAMCRAVGIPARVHNGPIFPPGTKNDHVWAEVYFPRYGWMPVAVTYSEVAAMVPGLTDAQRRQIRDFFFGRMDRWRFVTERSDLAQELVPLKHTVRRHVTMFTRAELECGGQNVERSKFTWECQPLDAAARK